jgi:hypothetical protein
VLLGESEFLLEQALPRVSTLPCASIEAGASIEAPFDPLVLSPQISGYFENRPRIRIQMLQNPT